MANILPQGAKITTPEELGKAALESIKMTVNDETGMSVWDCVVKQIPKKIWGNKHNPVCVGDTVSGLCPVCNAQFVCITPRYYKENGLGYCKECGQRLDWDESEV